MTSLKGDLRSIMGTPFGGVGHAVLIFSRVTRAAFNSDSVVLQLHDRIEMPEEADGKFQVDGLDPGPIRIELEGGTVHNHGWNIDLPDEGVWSLTDLVDAQVDWSPAVIGRAEAAAREARDHADRAEAGADRVGTAEQVGVWASEASSSASAATSARSAAQSARDVAEGHASRAATSESNAAASESAAKQSEDNAGDYAAVATTAATEAVDAMELATDIAVGEIATRSYIDSGLATKADKSYVDNATNRVGHTTDAHAGKFVKLDNEGKLFIQTASITNAGDIVNKAYVDTGDTSALRDAKDYVDQVISDRSWFKGYIHINDHLDDITESGGWTQQYTPLEGKGYPALEGGFLSVFFGLNGWRIDFYSTWRGKQFVRRQTSSGVWSDWLQVADTELFSRVDGVEDRVLALEESGVNPTPAVPTLTPLSLDWTHWGDSLTDNTYANGATVYWTDLLAENTGATHWNEGWGGQRTEEIAARAGALPSIVTVAGNSIPASGTPVGIDTIKNRPTHRTGRKIYGTLAGREGYIENTSNDNSQFVPTSGDVATDCPAQSRFYASGQAATTPARHVTIWTGYNDRWDRTPEQIVSHIDAIVQRHTVNGARRVLVMQVPRGGGADPDGQTSQRVDAYNFALSSAFPAQYVPICDLLQTEAAATHAGITFTAEDQLDISEGKNPRSFRTDSVHFNDAGHRAIAAFMWEEIQSRGWA